MASPREAMRRVSEILAADKPPTQQLAEALDLARENVAAALLAIRTASGEPLWQREGSSSEPVVSRSTLPPYVEIVTTEPHPLATHYADAVSVILRRIDHFDQAERGNRLMSAHRAVMEGVIDPAVGADELTSVFSAELRKLYGSEAPASAAGNLEAWATAQCKPESSLPQEYRTLCSLLHLGMRAKDVERARQHAPLESRIFTDLDLGLVILDEQGFVAVANRSAAATFGTSSGGLLGKHHAEIISPIAEEDLAQPLAAYLSDGRFGPCNVMLRQPGGRAVATEISFARIDFPAAQGHVIAMRDTDIRNHDVEDWRWRATHDSLTGLLNRQGLAQAVLSLTSSDVMVLYLDLDGFKAVNDSLGHAAGDQVITRVASTLVKSVKNDDLIARVGGDEFVVIGDAPSDNRALRRVSVRLAKALANTPIEVAGTQIAVTAAIGAAIEPRHAEIPTLLQRADRLMIEAKRSTARHRVMAEPIAQLAGYDDAIASWDPYRLEIFGGFRSKGIVPDERVWLCAAGEVDSVDLELEWARPYPEPVRSYALRHQLGIPYNQWLFRYLTHWPSKGRFVSVVPIEPGSRFVDRLHRMALQRDIDPGSIQITFDSGDLADAAAFDRAIKTAKHSRNRGIRTAIRWQGVIGGEISQVARIEPTLLQVDLGHRDSRSANGRLFTALAAFCDKLGAELRVSGFAPGHDKTVAELAARYPAINISLQGGQEARAWG